MKMINTTTMTSLLLALDPEDFARAVEIKAEIVELSLELNNILASRAGGASGGGEIGFEPEPALPKSTGGKGKPWTKERKARLSQTLQNKFRNQRQLRELQPA